MAELKQMLDKHVWHGVHTSSLTPMQRSAIIRSFMFLKDKFLAFGAFERFKARLVAAGNQQDKGLHDDLSSPRVATSSVLTVAAKEGRRVIPIDIGGAFLNADMSPTGIDVHIRLDRVMSLMLIQLDPSYEKFRDRNDTVVVRLDKALYGCVEASPLWYKDLKSKLVANGFVENPYDRCLFNIIGSSGYNGVTKVSTQAALYLRSDQPSFDRLRFPRTSIWLLEHSNGLRQDKLQEAISKIKDFTMIYRHQRLSHHLCLLFIAAMAAAENRKVIAIDIGGAFLSADTSPTGIDVHMRIDRVMSTMLIQFDPSYEKFRGINGTVVVRLDRALHGCVEASLLWYKDLKSKLVADGFIENSYDRCVFNKIGCVFNKPLSFCMWTISW